MTLAIVEAVQAQAALALGPAAAQEAAAALAAGAGRAPAAVAAQPLALVDVRIKWPNDVYSGGKKARLDAGCDVIASRLRRTHPPSARAAL